MSSAFTFRDTAFVAAIAEPGEPAESVAVGMGLGAIAMAATGEVVSPVTIEVAGALGGLGMGASVNVVGPIDADAGMSLGGIGMAAAVSPVVNVQAGMRLGGIGMAAAGLSDAWTPDQLGADLLAWYGPDSTYSAGTWQDLSGLGRNTFQATGGLQPAQVAGVLNGKPVIRFADDWISCGTGWDYVDISVFVLVAPAVPINTNTIYPIMGAGAISTRRMGMFFGGFTAPERFFYQYVNPQQAITDQDYAANVFNLFCVESTTGSGAELRLYRNDVQAGTTQAGTVQQVLAEDEMRMGQRVATAFTGSFSGDFFEYIVTRKLTLENRQKVAGYMLHNAALQSNLPIDHPYRTVPPEI